MTIHGQMGMCLSMFSLATLRSVDVVVSVPLSDRFPCAEQELGATLITGYFGSEIQLTPEHPKAKTALSFC